MPAPDNKTILLRAIDEFNKLRNREGYFELYSTDAVLHRSPPLAPGIDAIRQWYRLFWEALPDCHISLDNIVAEGQFVANNFRLQGSHRGPFLGVPPAGV